MGWIKGACLFGISFCVVFGAVYFVNAQEVSFVSNPVWLSTLQTSEGETVLASTVITKSGADSVEGEVTFYSNGNLIGAKQFSLPSNAGGTVVTVSFSPQKGTHLISAKVTKARAMKNGVAKDIAVSAEAKANETLMVEPDADRDGIADANDPDDDNDGVSDADEAKKSAGSASSAAAEVAGASTTELLSGAADTAKNVGATVFAKAESLRGRAANYFEMKRDEAEAARAAKQAAADDFLEEDIEERLVAKPKPLTEQLQDTSGILEGVKIQAYKALSFIFGNIYAFYLILIGLVLWILRKMWRRHSLD